MSVQQPCIAEPSAKTADMIPGAYLTFLGIAGLGYVLMLLFVFAYGIFGEFLTADIDNACAEAAFNSGKQQEMLGNYDFAIQRYRQALQGNFPSADRLHQCQRSIGEVLTLLGRYEEAIELYRGLKPEAMSQPGHWTAYVTALWKTGDPEAEATARKWLQSANAAAVPAQQVWANATLGQICEEQKRPDEALACYQAAAAIDPTSQTVVLAAKIRYNQGEKAQAIEQLETYIDTVKTGQLHEDAKRLLAGWKAQ